MLIIGVASDVLDLIEESFWVDASAVIVAQYLLWGRTLRINQPEHDAFHSSAQAHNVMLKALGIFQLNVTSMVGLMPILKWVAL